jgi:putative FmdB family regulatory protein
MPVFEFACRTCSRQFEQLLFGKEKPSCPACHGSDLEKLLSTFAVGGAGASASTSWRGGAAAGPGGGCGSCGDPRGPGSCAID